MQVREIMSGDIACCTQDTSIQDAAKMMEECDCGAIPVVESEKDHHLTGIITDRDIVIRAIARGKNPLNLTVADCMSTSVETVSQDAGIETLVRVMERSQIRRVPVTDEYGNCIGIVSQADIARKAPEHDVAEVLREVSEPAGQHVRG